MICITGIIAKVRGRPSDVEWLLATRRDGRGPIDWSDGSQQGLVEHTGLDLRGADLQFISLSRLPLTKMRGGLTGEECLRATADQRDIATIHSRGRGFFPGIQNKPSLHDPLVMLAAIEAVIGLFIEISFIAIFTKRFFGN